MGSNGRPAINRCRKLHSAKYDDYYYTVLLSVGLKDAFSDDKSCSFKVSEPTMHTAESKEVHPDAIFQCDGDTKGVVCEIKSSLPQNRQLLLRDLKEQVGKYTKIEEGWMTDTGKIGEHSVLLLVRQADVKRARDLMHGDAGGKSIPAEHFCLGSWDPPKAGGPGAADVIRLGREEGSTGCKYLDSKLDAKIEMPLDKAPLGYEKRRFVKADPPDLYMLAMLYQNILPGLVGDDGHITVSIEDLNNRIAKYFTSWSGLPGEQSQTRPRWTKSALKTLRRIGMAKKLPDGRYRINPLPRKKSIRDFLLDRLCDDGDDDDGGGGGGGGAQSTRAGPAGS